MRARMKIGKIYKQKAFNFEPTHYRKSFNLWIRRSSFNYYKREGKDNLYIPLEYSLSNLELAKDIWYGEEKLVELEIFHRAYNWSTYFGKELIGIRYPRRIKVFGTIEELEYFIKLLIKKKVLKPVKSLDRKLARWRRERILDAL